MDKNNELDHTHDDCPYCQDAAAREAGTIPEHSHDDCPYCARLNHAKEEGHPADCQYCQSYEERQGQHDEANCPYCQSMAERQNAAPEAAAENILPTTTDSQNYEGQNLDAPAIDKPDPTKEPAIGLGASMDAPSNNNEKLNVQGVPNEETIGPKEGVQLDHSKEALQAIAQEIESNGQATPAQSDAQVAESIPDTAIAQADTNMDGNTSRPEGFGANTPSDTGMAGENEWSEPFPKHPDHGGPDLTSVLHEGLDNNSDSIQRERVVQMVSQALQGFKASKDILERAQQQAPQLYQSSIAMLKAMIEMARMLGFSDQEVPADQNNPLGVEQQPAAQGNEWAEPFPTHPDHGGQPMPGHAPSAAAPAQEGGSIGKPIGKLPTSATTEHVARTPLLPGAVNTQGQKKVIDPETGKTRWIDMKEGRVQSPTGIPVKPPKQGQNGSQA